MRRSIEKSKVRRGLKSARSIQMTAVRYETHCFLHAGCRYAFDFVLALTIANAASNQLAEAIPTARIQHWVASYEALVGAKVGCPESRPSVDARAE